MHPKKVVAGKMNKVFVVINQKTNLQFFEIQQEFKKQYFTMLLFYLLYEQ